MTGDRFNDALDGEMKLVDGFAKASVDFGLEMTVAMATNAAKACCLVQAGVRIMSKRRVVIDDTKTTNN
jgi:hypothetical protein